MPMRIYDAYAGPGTIWGPWVNIDPEIIAGRLHLSISAESVTQMPGPFEGQVHYFAAGAASASLVSWRCPGSTSIDVADSIQQIRVRFRSVLNGFAVRVTVNDSVVPSSGRSPVLERRTLPLGVEPPTFVGGRKIGQPGIVV